MLNQLDDFETALLVELKQHVETRAVSGPRRRRTAMLAAAAVLPVLGIGVSAALLIPDGSTSAPGSGTDLARVAYTVTSDEDRITVSIRELEDPRGLMRALRSQGLQVNLGYPGGAYSKLTSEGGLGSALEVTDGQSARVASVLSKGETLLVLTGDAAETSVAAEAERRCFENRHLTLRRAGEEYSLIIDRDSWVAKQPITVRGFEAAAGSPGALTVTWAVGERALCQVVAVTE